MKLGWMCEIDDCENPKTGSLNICESHRIAQRKELRQLSKPIKVTRIKPRTAKRAAQEARYRKRLAVWILDKKCAVVGCHRAATQCHHAKGREGDLLLNEEFWTPTCDPHHDYYTEHSKEAIEIGFSKPRNQKTEI